MASESADRAIEGTMTAHPFELGYNACREGMDIHGALERFQRKVLIPINFCEKGKYCGQVAGHEGECDDIPF